MSYTGTADNAATVGPRQVLNAGRSERAPSRPVSSEKPRQRPHRFRGARPRHRTNRQVRRAMLAPETRRQQPLESSNLSARATRLVERASDAR